MKKDENGTRKQEVQGTIRISSRGIGFITAEEYPDTDIEIDPVYINTALHGDRVKVLIHPQTGTAKEGENMRGEVLEIIVRARQEFVGTLRKEGGIFFLDPESRRMYTDIAIPQDKLGKANVGDKAIVKITTWTDPKKPPLGEVIEVIGKAGNHETEMRAAALEKGFRLSFSPEVLRAADEIKRNAAEIFRKEEGARRDLRSLPTCTIDPADAKDFDDALSIVTLPNGDFEVGVHIADPSFYVKRGSPIDKEASRRATSVYLVDRTIPMLPEVLSNDLCSLNPNEDKLAFSAIFEMDKNANVKKRWFGRTIINSKKRFTYEDAQKTLDEKKGVFASELAILDSLSKKLGVKRSEAGALSFERDEVRFELDKDGKPIRIYKKPRLETNKLIEHFMVLANTEVAHFMASFNKRIEESFVYRVHTVPKEDKMREIINLMHALGYEVPRGKTDWTAKDVGKLLEAVKGQEHEQIIQMATIQAMAKAVYATKNIGHFGLSLSHYTHFTSPIRRYPDTMVHRMLGDVLQKKEIPDEELAEYEALSRYATEQEIAANEAEWASEKFKHSEYMKGHVGEIYDGTITGLMEKGIFVSVDETLSEGMVRLRDIKDDFYLLDETTFSIVGQKKKRKFSLGDKVKIKVKKVDVEKRLIDFEFV
ncbi:MAG: ribonuclease R [Parcubacteria group bacterium]|nr:ribonuclease R [Parcubacteria group bacterium]